ncbi:MAG: sulfatase, partial [Spirochaetota bacterium]
MPRTPNVILINCDDLGWGDLSCYGHPQHRTPHLDRLADEGLRFTDFYMASPVCSPSRGAMLTGCYPRRIGFGDFDGRWVLFPGQPVGLNPQETTIAGMLKGQGYATRIIGKWHCGDQPEFLPTKHGFDGYYGIPYSNDMGRQQWKTNWPPLPLMRDDEVIEEQPDQCTITERYVEDALRFVRENRGGPFFLYLAHMYVHLPHYVQERFLRESRNGPYGGAVAAIDWATGVIMAELRKLGIDEQTMVIFTSDNGSRGDFGPSNGHLRGHKGTTWEGGQRVPLIVRYPGVVPSGRVEPGLAASIDLMPTIASLAGARMPADRTTDGIDLSELFSGQTDASPRESFFYYHRDAIEAVRLGDWKLHLRKGPLVIQELYNLRDDPGEASNRFADEPARVA